jgi:acetoin utilization deacetylase AcuC-like enzyme
MTTPTIPYLYHPRQIHNPNSASKSPLKPRIIHERIQSAQTEDQPHHLTHFAPALIAPVQARDLYPVHDRNYIDALFSNPPTIADGFGNKSPENMRAIRMTAGNFMLAADIAINPAYADAHPGVVLSLTSGFHHASHAHAAGFCTINALNAAAYRLHRIHQAKTLIVDGDWHYGDGCVNILHQALQGHYLTYLQSNGDHPLREDVTDLTAYTNDLHAAIKAFEPDVIFYQAGADAWIDDPLGGGLTMRELYERDLITLHAAQNHDIPVVVNLAGGYADCYENTIRIHMNTIEAMKAVFLDVDAHPDFTVTVKSGII